MTPIPTKLKPLFLNFSAAHKANAERTPPQRLIAPATAPLVMKAKSAFNAVIYKAPKSPEKLAANIVTIFERPILAPAGKNGNSGKSAPSKRLSTSASAPRMPKSETIFGAEPSFGNSVKAFFFVFNDNNNLIRNTRSGVSVF